MPGVTKVLRRFRTFCNPFRTQQRKFPTCSKPHFSQVSHISQSISHTSQSSLIGKFAIFYILHIVLSIYIFFATIFIYIILKRKKSLTKCWWHIFTKIYIYIYLSLEKIFPSCCRCEENIGLVVATLAPPKNIKIIYCKLRNEEL